MQKSQDTGREHSDAYGGIVGHIGHMVKSGIMGEGYGYPYNIDEK